ncbi:MAG: hypothetical protein JO070_04975 [Verrucomicrobia bacterium]|nr:hypothetical protein [Verrucomicrobiota bacterium]
MLVVVLVLDLWDFGAEKTARFILFHHPNREICRILEDEHEQEHEHEHEFSTSAFRLILARGVFPFAHWSFRASPYRHAD